VPIEGRRAVVVGRSRIVGLPMAMLLLHRHATVTLCHTRTADLGQITRSADILAVAAGQPNMITPDMVRRGAAVIDFGINLQDGAIVGDVDKAVAEVAGHFTPVPGGTGPMTNIMLMRNMLTAAQRQCEAAREG
jgi:methylenetetrahydrofolate dehydrogenase (NADP+) / methenyltetrahydrofolate cyclohydrolase